MQTIAEAFRPAAPFPLVTPVRLPPPPSIPHEMQALADLGYPEELDHLIPESVRPYWIHDDNSSDSAGVAETETVRPCARGVKEVG